MVRPFTEHNGMMNSTLKVVRGKVEEHFRERIDYVYTLAFHAAEQAAIILSDIPSLYQKVPRA